jgi:hypothetical protein
MKESAECRRVGKTVESFLKKTRSIAAAGCAAGLMALQCTTNHTYNPNPVQAASTSKLAGKILPAASMAKVYIEQGRPVDSAFVDPADGYFTLKDLSAGVYRVRIIASGYDTFSAMIQISPGYSYDFGGIRLAERNKNFDDSIPSVYDKYPANGTELIYLPPDKYSQGSAALYVSVSFDRPMNRESVEKALSISPPVQGGYFVWYQNTRKFTASSDASTYRWDGAAFYDTVTFAANGAKTMALDAVAPVASSTPSAAISTYSVAKSFTYYFPRSQCFTDTTYTIRISRSAVDTAGTMLDSALTFYFKTVQSAVAYEDIEMLPHDGDDWVALIRAGIALTFPRRMDEVSTQAGIKVNLKAKPEFLWQDYNHLTIYTGGFFVPDTTYVITIDAGVKDIEGKPWGKAETLSFATEPIRISSSQPVRGQIGVPLTNDIIFTFNTYMDRSSFTGRCALVSEDGDTASGVFQYRYYTTYNSSKTRYDTTFQLNQISYGLSDGLKKSKLYSFTVGAGIKDLNGYAMKENYVLQFITVP